MSIRLLDLRHVPDDEADGVRALLDARHIEFFETPPNRWGISAGAIWLRDAADAERAFRALGEFQHERRARVRAEHAAAVAAGEAPTVWRSLREEPARLLLAAVGIAIALALIGLPIWLLRG